MRHMTSLSLGLCFVFGLAACNPNASEEEVQQAIEDAAMLEQGNISELMMTVSDPNESVGYFQSAVQARPDDPVLKRYLGKALLRAGKSDQAVRILTELVNSPGATDDDRLALAEAQIRAGDWNSAEATLGSIPPTVETYDRYRLEAMVADSKKNWKKADSFYEIAAGLTTKPAGVLNNWGFSKLTRGDPVGAEKLFVEAVTFDNAMFTAKNNLVLARAAQRKYEMPVVPMSQTERAELLYTMGLAAVKQGDTQVGRALLQEAVETHPQYFEAAARSLAALES